MDGSKRQHARIPQGLQNRERTLGGDSLLLLLHLLFEPTLFLVVEPFRVSGSVRQVNKAEKADDHRRQRFANKQPLPAGKSPDAIELKKRGRYGRAEPQRHGYRRHKSGNDARPMQWREEVREIEDHSGEKASLGKAQTKPQAEEADRPLSEGKGARNNTPGDHDAPDPEPRPDFFQDQVARHLKQEVAPEECAGSEPVNVAAEPEILVH